MFVDVEINPDGSVRISVDKGEAPDFETAKAALAAYLDAIGQSGASLELQGEIERHVHPRKPHVAHVRHRH